MKSLNSYNIAKSLIEANMNWDNQTN
jgi:hypothetical protein